jgi:hypothetical protein
LSEVVHSTIPIALPKVEKLTMNSGSKVLELRRALVAILLTPREVTRWCAVLGWRGMWVETSLTRASGICYVDVKWFCGRNEAVAFADVGIGIGIAGAGAAG